MRYVIYMVYLFCAYREWALSLYEKLIKKNRNFILLKDPKKLKLRYIKKLDPKFIFFPDWSWIVSKDIINNYDCICIHESNLPKFRGGSPLQNQIIRGIRKTKSTAFLMTEGLDEGDILIQKNISLIGSLDEIFKRMIKNDYEIILEIVEGRFRRRKQKAKPTFFKRRKPSESELKSLDHSKRYLYDFIRMLAHPYPNAFLKVDSRKIIFKSAIYDGKKLRCEVEIE